MALANTQPEIDSSPGELFSGLAQFSHHSSFLHRGVDCSLDRSSYCFLNPVLQPGVFAFAASQAVQDSIGSQVACRLALEHFTEGTIDFCSVGAIDHSRPAAVGALEAAFRRANQSVYSFSHGLAAGGRLAASLIGLVLFKDLLAVARVGTHSAYLIRSGELFALFEDLDKSRSQEVEHGGVGTQAKVEVEVSSLAIEAGDTFVLIPQPLNKADQELLLSVVEDLETLEIGNAAAETAGFVCSEPRELPYLFLSRIGSRAHFLR